MKRTLGDEHPNTLGSMNNLASFYSDVGRRQEALQLTKEVLEVMKRTLGDEHPDTLRSTENLKILKLRLSEEAHVVPLPEKRKGIRAAFKKLFR
jgi:Tetratricopeptide repeat